MPSFKSNLDIQQNQLLNAVLHTLRDLPENPVAGQLYYNEGKHTAYLYNGSWWMPWGEYSPGPSQQTNQYILNIPNPSIKSSMVFVRLYDNQDVVRIDSHFSTGSIVNFNIESRSSVNEKGFLLTDNPIQAVYEGTETTAFANSSLPKDNWLYIEIVQKDDGTIVPKDEEQAGLPGETEPPAATTDSEILGLLTITITCITT
ncbi:MAG: hypothetical protein WCP08_16785 [Prolixibacteraceae bacterium]